MKKAEAEAALPKTGASRFIKSINKANREEDVIAAYQRLLPGEWQRPFASDGYEHDALWEFKYGVNLDGGLSKVVAQGCYYLRKCLIVGVYKGQHFPLPNKLVVADDNEAVVISTESVIKFVSDDAFDWDRPPSDPDPSLVKALSESFPATRVYNIDDENQVDHFIEALNRAGTQTYSEVTRHNFVSLFTVWKTLFPEGTDPQTLAYSYLIDLAKENALLDEANGRIVFITDKGKIELPVSGDRYKAFWATYKRPPQYGEMQALYDRKDQLVAIQKRRMTGEFFTPVDIAEKAHDYIKDGFPQPEDMYKKVWWDCCCGTGNLTFHCPDTTPLYLSTLEAGDLEVIRQSGQNPQAVMFQFDFLNDPWDKLPAGMIERIQKDGELVVMINPPFAKGIGGLQANDGASMKGTTDTQTAKNMVGLDYAPQNLYTQFMFRLLDFSKTFGVKITLGMFSKAIFAGGPGYKAFRELWEKQATYINGFGFHAEEFQGTKGDWPCVYHVWRINGSVRNESRYP